jgi:uncharacterized protein (TIGR02145 family)
MVENLKTTRYDDSSAIPLGTDNTAWMNLTSAAYCWYLNDSSTYKNPYGALYNWYAVNTGKLAPVGWHVPSDSEWSVLVAFAGGDTSAGGVLKEAGNTHWASPNTGATNNPYGFSALPGGCRNLNGTFGNFGGGYWWSSTAYDANYSWTRFMFYYNASVIRQYSNRVYGFSVRCIRDNW